MKQNKAKDLTVKPMTEVDKDNLLPKMITRKEVAEYLKVSIQSVINYTNRGILISYKIGRRVLYNELDVIAAIQKCAVDRYHNEKIIKPSK